MKERSLGNEREFVVICRKCGKRIKVEKAERPPDANGNNYGHGICESCAEKERQKIGRNMFSK
jgi:hypothetical protein